MCCKDKLINLRKERQAALVKKELLLLLLQQDLIGLLFAKIYKLKLLIHKFSNNVLSIKLELSLLLMLMEL